MTFTRDTQIISKEELKNIRKEKLNPQNIDCLFSSFTMKYALINMML